MKKVPFGAVKAGTIVRYNNCWGVVAGKRGGGKAGYIDYWNAGLQPHWNSLVDVPARQKP